MKKLLTIALSFVLFIGTNVVNAQSLAVQAENQTKEMAAKLKLNEAEILKVKQFNLERLEQIAALASLREKSSVYLDMRLDQIEEAYASSIYNTLNEKQFKAFANYKKAQPFTYAGVINKMGSQNNSAIAIAAE